MAPTRLVFSPGAVSVFFCFRAGKKNFRKFTLGNAKEYNFGNNIPVCSGWYLFYFFVCSLPCIVFSRKAGSLPCLICSPSPDKTPGTEGRWEGRSFPAGDGACTAGRSFWNGGGKKPCWRKVQCSEWLWQAREGSHSQRWREESHSSLDVKQSGKSKSCWTKNNTGGKALLYKKTINIARYVLYLMSFSPHSVFTVV